ncbi:hypothetical protein IFM89_028391 [Coptis chinensis]|uniref:Peptidase S54 rhomboid domain-containing protein n=1 Tax=Coptis chinensis TaxID=261450 RepID=A0A835H9F1_9MAGN|nr:hypothetical protein IFM89_028391 [Coptis chinensis]
MDRGDGRRGTRGMLPLLAVHTIHEYYRSERKPPVTAGLLLANTLIYLRPGVLDTLLPTLNEVWFNPHLILKHQDLKRFFLSPFYHMGLLFFDYKRAFYYEHAVGFSGVLFALKVVLNSQEDENSYVHGLIVPARYAVWAELVLIQLMVPGVSFIGHLGGILAGILYLRLKGSYPGSDPVVTLLRGVSGVLRRSVNFVRDLFGFQGRGFLVGELSESRGKEFWCLAMLGMHVS